MVVMDRNGNSDSNHRQNGASSAGGSSNNSNPSDDSSSSSEDEHEPGMRVGADYQAEIPEMITDVPAVRRGDSRQEALLVWLPNGDISDAKLDEYILLAKERYGYNTEQALGMLFWHKHNVDKSLADLPNFTPFPDEWSVEDKVLFEQAFSFHGKSFHRIRQMLPDKSISCLVKYYYQWKKTRTSTSLMDRQARKLAGGQKENESEVSDAEEKTDEKMDETFDPEKESKTPQTEASTKSICSNCASTVSQLHTTPKGLLCNACYSFWRRTGVMRTHVGPVRNETTSHRHHPFRTKKKPPKGMYLDHDDLMAMTTNQGDSIFKALDAEIINLKRQIQLNKQFLGQQRSKLFDLNDYRLTDAAPRNNSRWTSEEQLIAVQAIRKYGRDYQAIADVVGNKNAAQCRSFMVNFRRRFDLDKVLEEWEADNSAQLKELKSKEEAEQQTDSAPSVTTSTTQTVGSSNNAPPPLLRPAGQSPSIRPPPLQAQQRFVSPRVSLQQPPPLIRPSVAPPSGPLARSRPPMMGPLSGPPPQLVGSQAESTSQ
ncbi:REST corepressor 3-like isoform X2 [Acanthaster planci]|uniref:REST corepressor 3-like isoform X2 n=1 Tax=Acanthaster planci TaxID=133434 RepID=A0A8B7YK72_ACAPL|nr:REST corepressor 3-like isoform X2 [Acanthaster planci]